jgi:hypothetical protein
MPPTPWTPNTSRESSYLKRHFELGAGIKAERARDRADDDPVPWQHKTGSRRDGDLKDWSGRVVAAGAWHRPPGKRYLIDTGPGNGANLSFAHPSIMSARR